MDRRLFEKIIDDLQEFPENIKNVRLYYLGEPFLCPDFLLMLKMLSDGHVTSHIEITTNGSMLTNENAEQLLEIASAFNGDIYLRFSIYSVIQNKHQDITKSGIAIERIHENIKFLYGLKEKKHIKNVFLYAKMIDSYGEENSKFLRYYYDVVDEASIEEPMNWSGFNEKNLLEDSYTEPQLKIINSATIDRSMACSYPFTTMAILSDGKVVCCCVDWSRQTYIGDVTKNSLLEIWNGDALKQIRTLHLLGKRGENPACLHCNRLPQYDEDDLSGLSPTVLNY